MSMVRWILAAGFVTAVAQGAENDPSAGFAGKIAETTNAGRYTYVQVDTGSAKLWAAAPALEVKVGDAVTVPAGMPMINFHSDTLKRTFDVVYFVPYVQKDGAPSPLPAQHPPIGGMMGGAHGHDQSPAVALDYSGITKAEGGMTVTEVFSGKSSLDGKTVTVRGRVARFTKSVMNRNWIHLRDGTGKPGSDDLRISTDATAAQGDLVLVKGTLVLNKDLGAGIRYDVLVENASVNVEKPATK
jgi:hypothetical protein